ncbi:hypothetical protein TNCV_3280121 [Trichonephila clavipes]|nr:hypothetical protein TNCV_3280121 [Trichonephila clavipes]
MKENHFRQRINHLIVNHQIVSHSKTSERHLGIAGMRYPPTPENWHEYHLSASVGHALAKQHFSNSEENGKWLDEWFAAKDKQFFWHGVQKLSENG